MSPTVRTYAMTSLPSPILWEYFTTSTQQVPGVYIRMSTIQSAGPIVLKARISTSTTKFPGHSLRCKPPELLARSPWQSSPGNALPIASARSGLTRPVRWNITSSPSDRLTGPLLGLGLNTNITTLKTTKPLQHSEWRKGFPWENWCQSVAKRLNLPFQPKRPSLTRGWFLGDPGISHKTGPTCPQFPSPLGSS